MKNNYISQAYICIKYFPYLKYEIEATLEKLGYDNQEFDDRVDFVYINEGYFWSTDNFFQNIDEFDDYIDCNSYFENEKDALKLFYDLAKLEGSHSTDRDMLVECANCEKWHRTINRKTKRIDVMTYNYCPFCGDESIYLPSQKALINGIECRSLIL